ncbi:DnaJ protein, putative, partial [Hepatocystis sp. ex Piliocolobus tephrosceles]
MIGNKEDAYECFNLATKYMKVGNFSHAKNLFLKSKRMFPDIDISEKIKICEEEIKKTDKTKKEDSTNIKTTHTTFRSTSSNVNERHKTKDECLEKILKSNNYYEILGIPKDSNDETIKSAYKKLAKLYHPDKNKSKDAEEAFKKVSKAFQHLIDKDKRYEYDNYSDLDTHNNINNPSRAFRTTHYYYNDDAFTAEDIFRNFFGINFATCNNRAYRTHVNTNRAHTHNNTSANTSNNNQRNYSLVQLFLFLIMFIVFFLSSHFEQP